MTKPTTKELKDLLGKVTKPWRYEIDGDDGVHVVHCAVVGPYPHISTSEPDLASDHMKLIALAPTLAAEVVELRSIIERIVSEYYTDDNGRSLRWEVDIARQALSQE